MHPRFGSSTNIFPLNFHLENRKFLSLFSWTRSTSSRSPWLVDGDGPIASPNEFRCGRIAWIIKVSCDDRDWYRCGSLGTIRTQGREACRWLMCIDVYRARFPRIRKEKTADGRNVAMSPLEMPPALVLSSCSLSLHGSITYCSVLYVSFVCAAGLGLWVRV